MITEEMIQGSLHQVEDRTSCSLRDGSLYWRLTETSWRLVAWPNQTIIDCAPNRAALLAALNRWLEEQS